MILTPGSTKAQAPPSQSWSSVEGRGMGPQALQRIYYQPRPNFSEAAGLGEEPQAMGITTHPPGPNVPRKGKTKKVVRYQTLNHQKRLGWLGMSVTEAGKTSNARGGWGWGSGRGVGPCPGETEGNGNSGSQLTDAASTVCSRLLHWPDSLS